MPYQRPLSELDLEPRPIWAWIMRLSGVLAAIATPLAFLWPPTALQMPWLPIWVVSGLVFTAALLTVRRNATPPEDVPWTI